MVAVVSEESGVVPETGSMVIAKVHNVHYKRIVSVKQLTVTGGR